MAQNPEAFFLVVGGTKSQVERYSAMADDYEIGPHCLFTGLVAPSVAKHYCRLASVLVSPRSEGTNTPLKIYEQLASGIPLVATNISSHTQVLNGRVAFMVEPEPEDMARGILAALDPEGEAQQTALNAKRLYEQKYSRRIYKNKIQKLLDLLS